MNADIHKHITLVHIFAMNVRMYTSAYEWFREKSQPDLDIEEVYLLAIEQFSYLA